VNGRGGIAIAVMSDRRPPAERRNLSPPDAKKNQLWFRCRTSISATCPCGRPSRDAGALAILYRCGAFAGGNSVFLLWATQGVTAVQRDDAGAIVERVPGRRPSGGARYPAGDPYLAINRVTWPGSRHSTATCRMTISWSSCAKTLGSGASFRRACYGMPAVGSAAAVFHLGRRFLIAPSGNTRISRIVLIAMEAGHVCENLNPWRAEFLRNRLLRGRYPYHQPRVDELPRCGWARRSLRSYVACLGKPKPD